MPLDRATIANRIEKLLTDAGHPATGEGDFGWQMVAPNDGRDHVLIACEPSDWWRSMPGGVVRTAPPPPDPAPGALQEAGGRVPGSPAPGRRAAG